MKKMTEFGRKLSLSRLRKEHACPRYVEKFKRRFGKEVLVTQTLCIKEWNQWNWHWCARHLLSDAGRLEFNTRWGRQDRLYGQARMPLMELRDRKLKKVRTERAGRVVWRAFNKANEPLFLIMQRATAQIFADIYIGEGT